MKNLKTRLSLLRQLKKDYPQFKFIRSNNYLWSSSEQIVYYKLPINPSLLLHELGHGILKHKTYKLDIDLVKKEADAWDEARQLAKHYNVKIENNLARCNLETYKKWLNKRSCCPNCHLVGIQKPSDQNYSCINCHLNWSVPDDPQLKIKLLLI